MLRRSIFQALIVSFAAMACATATFAATTDTLADLAGANGNGGTGLTLTLGDKTFSDFTFQNSGLTNFDPTHINVTVSQSGGTYFLTWNGNMSLTSTGPATADLLLGYSVTATRGVIDAIDGSFTGSAQPHTTSFLSVDESAYDANGRFVGGTHLDDINPPGSHSDSFQIRPPQSFLSVTKDISFALAGQTGGLVTVSQVKQSFHQTQVPEPGTAMLLGVSLLGGSFFFRRRRLS